MGSDENVQRTLDAVRKCLLASSMKIPHTPKPNYNEIKRRFLVALNAMEQRGVISASNVRVIEDTPAEKLVREIMEEEEDTIRVETELRTTFPMTYLKLDMKIDPDS